MKYSRPGIIAQAERIDGGGALDSGGAVGYLRRRMTANPRQATHLIAVAAVFAYTRNRNRGFLLLMIGFVLLFIGKLLQAFYTRELMFSGVQPGDAAAMKALGESLSLLHTISYGGTWLAYLALLIGLLLLRGEKQDA